MIVYGARTLPDEQNLHHRIGSIRDQVPASTLRFMQIQQLPFKRTLSTDLCFITLNALEVV